MRPDSQPAALPQLDKMLTQAVVHSFMGNTVVSVPATCTSDGHVSDADADSKASLLHSLASAAACVRATKLALRKPGAALDALLGCNRELHPAGMRQAARSSWLLLPC